ncbi:MAG: mechanosensitive ion channel, partial [Bacteroidales bacterium]|nr:mechanosensitive ion channel [Bacteroidales bacterium]
MKRLIVKLHEYLSLLGFNEDLLHIIEIILIIIGIVVLAWLADYIVKKILLNIIVRFIKRTKTEWDDLLIKRRVFHRLAHLAPAIVIYYLVDIAFSKSEHLVSIIQSGTYIYMVIIILLIIDAFINISHDIYKKLPVSINRPIKGYIQLIKILIYFVGIILILSIILGKSPSKLLTGLGALAAVLMLVFKDTILGFV